MAGDGRNGILDSWETHRLDKVATIIDSLHKTPAYSEQGLPMVRVTDIRGGFLDLSGTLKVNDDVFEEFTRRHRPERGDIVFSRVGTYGNASYVPNDAPFCLGQNTAIIHPSIDSRFLHYCLQSPAVREQIEHSVVGSTQKTISLKSISALQIPVPPPQELGAIAHILGTLDDKIELNRRMNETLEAMARALFKSWFVDFDPVRAKVEGRDPGLPKPLADLFPDSFEDSELGEIPKGWAVGRFGDVVDLLREQECPLLSPGVLFQHFSIPAFDEGQTARMEYGESIKSLKSRVPAGVVLFSKLNPEIERVWLVDVVSADRAVCSTEFLVLNPLPPFTRSSMYCLMRLPFFRQQIVGLVTGTSKSHQRAQVKSILNLPVVIPPSSIGAAFDRTSESLLARTLESRRESRTLSTLREALLPKLISGELRVNDARRFVEHILSKATGVKT
jgi:type I restriction enzyme, S subunit